MKRAALLSLVALVALTGCKKSDPLVGKWKASVNQGGASSAMTMDLTSDNKVSTLVDITAPQMTMSMTMTGTWSKPDATHVQVTYTDAKADTSKLSPQLKALMGDGSKLKDMALQQANSAGSQEVKWQGDDKLTITLNNQAVTFDRVK